MVEESIYQHLHGSYCCTHCAPKQHVVEHFTGTALCSARWSTECIVGANTHRMADVANGGYEMITSTTINSNMKIDFCGINQYSETTGKLIAVVQRITCSANNNPAAGFIVSTNAFTSSGEGIHMRVINRVI